MNKKKMNPTFVISLIIVAIIVVWGLGFPGSFETVATVTKGFITDNFSWFYAAVMTGFVAFVVWLGFFSKYKDIRLGPDDSKPEYSNISWFAMLFSAGMGIGLVFWGVAEPLNFYMAPIGAEAGTPAAAQFAITKAFLHWGLHPWANYAVLALALAYMQFRKNKPGLISSIFIPLIGEERVKGPIGKTIDILAIFATVAGVATSLGLGAMQINSGLNFLFDIPENNVVLIIIVVIVTAMFMTSAITGVDKGIKFLSNANVALCCLLALACLIVGPTRQIFNTLIEGIGDYIQELPHNSFAVGAYSDSGWYGGWTIFYWSWWIAWAPFTGTFIARISKGRTVKEFIMGVTLVPALVSFVWFAIFGTLGINTGTEVASEAIQNTSTALFVVLKEYPMGAAISLIVVVLLCTFFVTSADSATFVLGMLSSYGDLNPKTSRKVVWGVIQSLLALALLLGTVNGLEMLQAISIVAALPFALVMIGTMVSTVKVMKSEKKGTLKIPKMKQE
ncbi:BCCT family transporter [Roseburia hominis]